MAAAQLAFGCMNVLARVASSHAGWAEVASARTLVGAGVAFGVARARGASLVVHDQRKAWARSLAGTGAMLCVFYTLGAPAIALGDVVTLGATSPIFIALLAPRLLGEPSGPRVWWALLGAFAGAALVVGPSFHAAGHVAAVATLGAVFTAIAMIWLRRLGGEGGGRRESPEAVALHFSLVASAATSALAARSWSAPDAVGWLLLAATGVAGGLAQIAMTRAYALERAARVGAVGYLGVVVTHLLGAVVLGERASFAQLAGSAIVVASGLALALGAVREARAVPTVAVGAAPCVTPIDPVAK
jgi:drug/metabolite transporter (DMT)-like permease